MARLDELWKSVGGPDAPPGLEAKRVKARVNAALDADRTERKVYMKQKWRAALAAAAVAAVLTGTAFAATAKWNGLSAWFQGDDVPVREYVDSEIRSVSDKDYTLTVEGAASDEGSAYATVTITALSEEAKAFLHSDRFISMDMLSAVPVCTAPSGASGAPMAWSGPAARELECAQEHSRRFALSMSELPQSTTALWVRCGYMEEGVRVEVPLNPAPSVTVKVGASGQGALYYKPAGQGDSLTLTIDTVTLSPFTCRVEGRSSNAEVYPRLLFRMADGSVRTQAQMLGLTGAHINGATGRSEYHYRFQEIQDLGGIASVIVFDTEYPLDGSKPVPADHDSALDPFTVTRMEPLAEEGGYSIAVRELTEKLGGTCVWDAASGAVTCTYRGVSVVLREGSAAALVDGEAVELRPAPAEQDGVLAAGHKLFQEAWGIDCAVLREEAGRGGETELLWGDWYVIP